MKGGLLLDVVVRKSAAVLELLASEDQTLLVRGNSLLVYAVVRWLLMRCDARRGCLPWILDLTLSMVSDDSTSRVIVLPVTARPSVRFPVDLLLASRLTGLNEDLHSSWATCRPWADSCRCLLQRKVMWRKVAMILQKWDAWQWPEAPRIRTPSADATPSHVLAVRPWVRNGISSTTFLSTVPNSMLSFKDAP